MARGPAEIREAEERDRDAIASLYLDLNRHHRALAPGNPRFAVPDEAWSDLARRAIASRHEHVLVAVAGDEVVGFVRYTFVERPWGPSCDVNTLVVAPAARRQGVGRALMAAAEDAGIAAGAKGIRLDVQDGNDDAAAFYEALGYERFAVRYGKMLG